MQNAEYKKININDIQKYSSEIKKYQLCFCSATQYFGLFKDDELLGFFGIIILKNKVVFKNDFMLEKHRGKGYYKYMMNYRMFFGKKCRISRSNLHKIQHKNIFEIWF